MTKILSKPKFTRKPAIFKRATNMKKIPPSLKSIIVAAESTSYQRSLRTLIRRCLRKNACYLNSYWNNKPNGKRREPECLPNSPVADPPTNRKISEISLTYLR